MRTNKILIRVAVAIVVLLVALLVCYFITKQTAFDGSWEHTYSRGLILFICVLWLTVLFWRNSGIKNKKLPEEPVSKIVGVYELTPAEKEFIEFFILYAKNLKITKNELEDFFYNNFRILTLEFSGKYNGNILRIDNVAEVIKISKKRYHDH